ncbi:MAG TPA: translocation/assembly module TamB domain-containing protein [Myxococcales bacterium]|nr:translocation/assembly module TamB domain-containing protein [Myxococcales bacterium]
MLSLVGLLAVAVIAAVIWLHTGAGAAQVARLVTEKARGAIQGDLRVQAVHVGGFLRVCVDGVELRDPDGNTALRAERACVKLQPLPLAAHDVVVTEALLEKPWIEIAKVPGTSETTLQRAIKPRKPPQPGGGGPFAWKVDVRSLQLRGGSLTVRPELGEEATFALQDLDLSQAHATYSADAASAAFALAAGLAAPGKAPVALNLDLTLDGPAKTGTATLRSLRLRLGESGLAASGSWDLGRNAGEVHLRELVVTPGDLALFAPRAPLQGTVRGEADLKSDGRTAGLDLRLDAGGGRIESKLTATLETAPVWDLQLTMTGVDPGAVSSRAPRGEVTARVSLHGKGKPQFDAHGVRGELSAAAHVGPARLDRVGPVVADVKTEMQGRYALVRAFTATALGLTVKAHGAAAYDEISIDLDVSAPDLGQVGRAVGALTGKPSLPMGGSMHLAARVTGSPRRPDAQLTVRAPEVRWSKTLVMDGLTVRGTLSGPLRRPDGTLKVAARRLIASAVDLGAPRIDMELAWPSAHLRVDAAVAGGVLQLAGDARINDDKDGLLLSNFLVAWPGNTLHLANDTRVHIGDVLVLEPLELTGEHGSVRFEAQLQPPPGRIDAAVVVTKFELTHLPLFALPRDLDLRGVLDANAVLQGPRAAPDLDLQADVRGAGARPTGDLLIDAHTHAHVHHGVLKTEGWVAGDGVLRFDFQGEVPVQSLARQPASIPLRLDATLAQVDLAKLADRAKIAGLQRQRVHGIVDARVVASGTLGAPRATVSVEARDLGSQSVSAVDARAGLLFEKTRATLDATVSLGGERSLSLTAQAPVDLPRALRDRAYLRGALDRPVTAELAVTQLQLARLVKSGLLPEGSEGAVSLSAKLSGTPLKPVLQVTAAGEKVTAGRLHGLDFQGELGISDKVKLTFGAQSQTSAVMRMDAAASVSGAELVAAARRRAMREALGPLLDRSISLTLEVPGLPIARASRLAGKPAVAEGRLDGHLALSGTAARPQLRGEFTLKDLQAKDQQLGAADLYLEADSGGALLHVGIDPPGGGNFLGHLRVDADLGARTLLARGAASVMGGKLSGEVRARRLDLAFLSGLIPRLRRAGGTLEGDVKVAGLVGKPVGQGDAHLRGGVFDVVGQGVYEDVGLDANFSPKEVVIDRITGTEGAGTFSAILVAARRPPPGDPASDRVEFTGEIHLGDAESVRDRKVPSTGKPLQAGPLPLRQAGEQRADLNGELDLYGDYTGGVLTLNTKIPDARLVIKQLPDKKLPSLKENPDIILVHPGERPHPPGREPEDVAAEEEARKNATFRLHAHLDLNHLYVKAPDFEFPVESHMNFDYDARHPDTPTADGVIHVPQGSFSALGRRFTIDDAKIIETGGEISDPELEVKALFDNPQAAVTISVTGTAKNPQLDLSSNPVMDQDQIAFFLATGRIQGRATQQGGGVDLSGAATSVVGSLLFGQVRKELADVLPVDVITIDSNAQGVAGASVGKYIGDRVFVGYRQRFAQSNQSSENTVEGRIEYEISRSLSAEATVGDVSKDLSILYTKDF